MTFAETGTARPVRGFLIVNPRAGSETPTAGELAAAARTEGIDAHVLQEGEDAAQLARGADAEVLGVAGGDGTVSSIVDVAVTRDLPLVCVPFGTRNHFARDLGLDPDDPIATLAAFRGEERRVDVGRANGHLFVNNVSLGAYARLVHRRERHRRRSEALAALRALARTARRAAPIRARVDGAPVRARVLLVANNAYKLDLFSIGARERLDGGRLHLYVAEGLLPNNWSERSAERFTIDLGGGVARAAIDGEPVEVDLPLELSIEPRALRLLVPPAA